MRRVKCSIDQVSLTFLPLQSDEHSSYVRTPTRIYSSSGQGLSSHQSADQALAPSLGRARTINQQHYYPLEARGSKQRGRSYRTGPLIMSLDPLGPHLIGLVVWLLQN